MPKKPSPRGRADFQKQLTTVTQNAAENALNLVLKGIAGDDEAGDLSEWAKNLLDGDVIETAKDGKRV